MLGTGWEEGRVAPVTLEGETVRLEPLRPDHHADLLAAAQDERIWQYTIHDPRTPEGMRAYILGALADRDRGDAMPFAVYHRDDGRVIGATRYHGVSFVNRGLQVGFTWYHPDFWRTRVNTECKFLLLRHAFDVLGCIRVELHTDARNERSRQAILRLGAIEEGTLRSKAVLHDGHRRDAVYFSILDREWPDVRRRLEAMLSAR